MPSGGGSQPALFRCGAALAVIGAGGLLATLDARTTLLARNTLGLAAGAVAIAVPLGTLLALLLTRTDLSGRRLLLLSCTGLLFVPLYVQAAGWAAGFGQLGWLAGRLGPPHHLLLWQWTTAIAIHGLAGLPWVVLILATALRWTESQLEQDALQYRSGPHVVWSVTLRRAAPGLGLAALWVALSVATDMTVTDLYQIRTLAEEIYTALQLPTDEPGVPGGATALAFAGVLAGVLLLAAARTLRGSVNVPAAPPYQFALGRWRPPLTVGVWLAMLVLLGLPLVHLLIQTGRTVQVFDGSYRVSWSLEKLLQLLTPWPGGDQPWVLWRFRQELGWTVLLGATVATGVVVCAVPLGWLARLGGRGGIPSVLLTALCLVVSGPLIGLALMWLFSHGTSPWSVWLADRTLLVPGLAVGVRSLPWAILVCWAAFGSIPRAILDGAAVDGAGPWARFWFAGLAQRRAAVGVAWLVAFALAAGDLTASILVMPLGVTTLPIRVFGMLHAGADDQVAAISLLSVVAYVGLGLAIGLAGRRWIACGRREFVR